MPTSFKTFGKGLAVFVLYLVVVNVAVRPIVRRATAAANVPQLGAII